MKVYWREFYGEEPQRPIFIEKYTIDDSNDVVLRPMTYEPTSENPELMYATFEVHDIIVTNFGKGKYALINKIDRDFNEYKVEYLDYDLKRTYIRGYEDPCDIFHKVKDVEWI